VMAKGSRFGALDWVLVALVYVSLALRKRFSHHTSQHLPTDEGFARLARVEGKIVDGKPTVLFLCTHNAGRSQMALGYFTHLAGDRAVAWSGGSEPGTEINPAAIAAMAAGNRVMLKPSELTPATSALLVELVAETFREDEFVVIEGDADIGRGFASLAFEHLFFTGSTAVGRSVAQSAQRSLTTQMLTNAAAGRISMGQIRDCSHFLTTTRKPGQRARHRAIGHSPSGGGLG